MLMRLPAAPVRRDHIVTVVILLVAAVVGASIIHMRSSMVLLALGGSALMACIALYPPLAAYSILGVTPLIAGIDRGLLIPVLRPNEALAVLAGAGLALGGILRMRTGHVPRLTITRVDVSILVMAVAGSAVPLAWALARSHPITQDDILYALLIWKYYGLYLLIRVSVKTEPQVRRCLWIVMIAAAIVAVIAILEAMQLFGITHALSHHYKPYGSDQALLNSRGGSTLSLPIAVADFMILNIALAAGFLVRGDRHKKLLSGLAILFVAGLLASGEFSGAIGLVIAAIVIVVMTRRVGLLAGMVPVAIGLGYGLRPVIQKRLQGFQSLNGLPTSWSGRLYNLKTYFWPELFSGSRYVLGVRPSARVATASMATGWVWIESGYTWLLWAGGIPFLGSFLYFLYVNLQTSARVAKTRDDAVGVAALAVVVGLVVIGILMAIDMHLTYRGFADLLFGLLALGASRIPAASRERASTLELAEVRA